MFYYSALFALDGKFESRSQSDFLCFFVGFCYVILMSESLPSILLAWPWAYAHLQNQDHRSLRWSSHSRRPQIQFVLFCCQFLLKQVATAVAGFEKRCWQWRARELALTSRSMSSCQRKPFPLSRCIRLQRWVIMWSQGNWILPTRILSPSWVRKGWSSTVKP